MNKQFNDETAKQFETIYHIREVGNIFPIPNENPINVKKNYSIISSSQKRKRIRIRMNLYL